MTVWFEGNIETMEENTDKQIEDVETEESEMETVAGMHRIDFLTMLEELEYKWQLQWKELEL